jgi:Tol biopolymer transport system component
MSADGPDQQRLYYSGCCIGNWAAPVWSPDSRMIGFAADTAGGTYLINADGSGLKQLSPNTPGYLSWQQLPQH